MKEKDITPKILQTIRDDKRFGSGLYEIKLARGATLRKGELKEHQYRALWIARNKEMYFKIPDCGYSNPADAFVMKKAEAWLVICFMGKQKAHEVWALSVDDIPEEGKCAIKIEEARRVGVKIYPL